MANNEIYKKNTRKAYSQLSFDFLLGQLLYQLGWDKVMPLPFSRRSFAHCNLERPQLRYAL